MSTAVRRTGGLFEGLYKVLMRRNSVYVTFVITGAFLGERAVDYGVHKLWENNNIGKRYEDISRNCERVLRSIRNGSFRLRVQVFQAESRIS
ncbi:hypothetical protein M8C21_007804, partial [Ambrosia artemisiifolia]